MNNENQEYGVPVLTIPKKLLEEAENMSVSTKELLEQMTNNFNVRLLASKDSKWSIDPETYSLRVPTYVMEDCVNNPNSVSSKCVESLKESLQDLKDGKQSFIILPFDAKQYNIDWEEASYVANKLLKGKIAADSVSQRVLRALKNEDKDLYLTLKVAQASAFYDKKVM